MGYVWQLQEAKNRLSEVVERARKEGPQTITKRGTAAAVVLSMEDYRKIRKSGATDLVEFFRKSPLGRCALSLDRSEDKGREVDL